MMQSSGKSFNEDFDYTNHGVRDTAETDRLVHCPICGGFMAPSGPTRKPLGFSDDHQQWAHVACLKGGE
jgi:hypothetical protein